MKKRIFLISLSVLGVAFQAQAVSVTTNQGGIDADQVQVDVDESGVQVDTDGVKVQAGQDGATVQTEEQNRITNQGEETQIQTQEKNTVEVKTGGGNVVDVKISDSKNKSLQKNQVANSVQTMLEISQRNGGIGQQIRIIAQTQNQIYEKLENNLEKIQSRSGLSKFFVGPNYGEIKDAQKTLEQNKMQIAQLNKLKVQLSNEGDSQQLTEQIIVLEQANQEIESAIAEAQSGFSLFGWFNKLIS